MYAKQCWLPNLFGLLTKMNVSIKSNKDWNILHKFELEYGYLWLDFNSFSETSTNKRQPLTYFFLKITKPLTLFPRAFDGSFLYTVWSI